MQFFNIEGYDDYLLGKDGDNDWSVWRIKKNGELKELKASIIRSGHIIYGLCTDGKHVAKALHALIAEMFIPIPTELKESGEKLHVHHRDNNPQNNRIENLCWLTESEHHRLHMKGKPHSEEHKRKISDALKGKHHSEESKRKLSKQVYQYDLEENLIAVWPSTCECGRNGYLQGCVSACCRGELKTYKGFKWSYEPPIFLF